MARYFVQIFEDEPDLGYPRSAGRFVHRLVSAREVPAPPGPRMAFTCVISAFEDVNYYRFYPIPEGRCCTDEAR